MKPAATERQRRAAKDGTERRITAKPGSVLRPPRPLAGGEAPRPLAPQRPGCPAPQRPQQHIPAAGPDGAASSLRESAPAQRAASTATLVAGAPAGTGLLKRPGRFSPALREGQFKAGPEQVAAKKSSR